MKDADRRQLMIGRLQHLEKMGLATELSPTLWQVGLEAEPVLRDMGMRCDIIKTMHRAMADQGLARGSGSYVIDGGGDGPPILGQLVEKGLHNELTGEAYVVIDATDVPANPLDRAGYSDLLKQGFKDYFRSASASACSRRRSGQRRTVANVWKCCGGDVPGISGTTLFVQHESPRDRDGHAG